MVPVDSHARHGSEHWTVDPKLLTAIAAACRGAHRLRFDYIDGRGAPTAHDVEPHRLVHAGRRWYLVARDTDRDDWRTFRLDRIGQPLTGIDFEVLERPELAPRLGVLADRPARAARRAGSAEG